MYATEKETVLQILKYLQCYNEQSLKWGSSNQAAAESC